VGIDESDSGTMATVWRLSFMMHCEAIAGPPADIPMLQYAQVRRHKVIYKYVHWLQCYARPDADPWRYRNEHLN